MAQVTGNNFTIYAGDDMNNIGCADNCIVNVTREEIIVTTKGSANGTNREYGRYDATIQATGVEFMYASESDAATANRQDPMYFHSYLVQGKKVCAKYEATDGITTKYVIANWIVRRVTFTGQAGNLMTFDIELALDGQLYESSAMKSGDLYDGPSVFIYEATSTVSFFTSPLFINVERIYFLLKNGVIVDNVVIVPGAGIPTDPDQIAFNDITGDVLFGTDLVDGDVIFISYEPF